MLSEEKKLNSNKITSFEYFIIIWNMLLLIIVSQSIFNISPQFKIINYWIINAIGIIVPMFFLLYPHQCKMNDQIKQLKINKMCLIFEKEIPLYINALLSYGLLHFALGILYAIKFASTDNKLMVLIFCILHFIFGLFILFNYFWKFKKLDKKDEISTGLFANRQLIYYGAFYSLSSVIIIINKILTHDFDKYFYSGILFLIFTIAFTYYVNLELRRISELNSLNTMKTKEEEMNILYQLTLLLKVVPTLLIFICVYNVFLSGIK